jgi:arginase
VYIDIRDIDPSEQLIMKQHKIKAFSMHDMDKYGIGKVIETALDHVNPDRKLPIHLSFNIDALDPFVAPSTVYPVCETPASEKYD